MGKEVWMRREARRILIECASAGLGVMAVLVWAIYGR